MTPSDPHEWIRALPKAELHVHIEGTLEPEMMFALAERNGIRLPYASIDALRDAYRFDRLDDFLALYYQGMDVLRTARDFHELTVAYGRRALHDGVCHAEVFFDPQAHARRSVALPVVMEGLLAGLDELAAEGLSSRLILCFLRDLSEDDALQTLHACEPWLAQLTGVGLDSSELGHPPRKFRRVFDEAGARGLRRVAHAGEEGPPDYVVEALDLLRVDRIDHGNRSLEDPALIARLRDRGITLTVCPLSNHRLGGVASLRDHPLRQMLALGLKATVNSDDPAYFGGYVQQNFAAMVDEIGLTRAEVFTLARNSFSGSFLDADEIARHLRVLDAMQTASATSTEIS